MKLLVLFMASSSLIYANAKFTDLQFIPSQGVFLGETSLNSTTTTAEVGSIDIDREAFGVSQEVSYGLQEGLILSAQITRSTEKFTVKSSSAKGVTDSEGFENPKFGVLKRFWWEKDNGFNLDLGASFSPDLFDAEDGNTDKDGTVASGSSDLSFFASFGRKQAEFQWALEAMVEFVGEAKEEDLDNGKESTTDAKQDLYIQASVQRDVATNFSIFGGVELGFIGELEVKNTDDSKTTVDTYTTQSLFAGAKFVAQKNLFFEFQYALTLPADYEAKNGSDVSKYEDLSASGFNLAVNYLF